MSTLDIITTLLAFFFAPVLVAGCWVSYRIGINLGTQRGIDDAARLWPQHSDYDDRLN